MKTELITVPGFLYDLELEEQDIAVYYFNNSVCIKQGSHEIFIPKEKVNNLLRQIKKHRKEAKNHLN